MKWVITGVLAVSAAAVLANGTIFSNENDEAPAPMTLPSEAMGKPGYMSFSNESGGSSASVNQPNVETEKSTATVQAIDPIGKPGYMTLSNDENKSDGGFYTTPGGCTAPRRPEIEHYDIAGAASLRFLESAYIHQVAASIEAAGGKCTCELRFPSWDDAVNELNNRFAKLPDDESSAWVRQFADQDRSRLTREINKHCKAQGIN